MYQIELRQGYYAEKSTARDPIDEGGDVDVAWNSIHGVYVGAESEGNLGIAEMRRDN